MVFRAGFGIFYTPVDMNTWCNMLHNAPIIFPETNQSDAFMPSITSFNFAPAVVGTTVTSFTAFDPYQKPQYVSQWTRRGKEPGQGDHVEVGYQAARGFHLQRSHLINNALPGPGWCSRGVLTRAPRSCRARCFPPTSPCRALPFRISALNWLENTARSWYDSGYINLRRRYSHGLSLLANYTFAKNLSDAPDFRSPMFEAAIPQNNNDLRSEKGPACDIRHRFSLSAVYDLHTFKRGKVAEAVTRNWQLSTIYQAQTGFPFTISVFGDTANAGTVLGENPVRANYTGQPVFGPDTKRPEEWFNPAAFSTPAAYTFGNAGRNTVYRPGHAVAGSRGQPELRGDRAGAVPGSPGSLQLAEQGESGNAEPFREYRAVRHHHRILHARARAADQRATFVVRRVPGWLWRSRCR